MSIFSKKYSTGLVLSGGAVRGLVHLGVLKAIDEKKLKIDMIAGTSAGALAGALYSGGLSPDEILDLFTKQKIYDMIRFSFPRKGFFRVEGLKKLLKKNLKVDHIEDLPIPLVICATNFREGKAKYFSEGPLLETLIASSSIPVLFETTYINNTPYVDGGVMDNLPVEAIRQKCKKVIAVHANPILGEEEPRNPAQIAERAFHLAIASGINRKKELVDIFIEPPGLQQYGLFDLKKGKEIFQIGYDTALSMLS